MFAWLPDIAKDVVGMTEIEGGLMLSVFAIAGTPMALAMPLIAERIRNVGWLAALGGLLIFAGFGAMLVAPTNLPRPADRGCHPCAHQL
jgi:CP family cyanate transporter-like MFS transporter